MGRAGGGGTVAAAAGAGGACTTGATGAAGATAGAAAFFGAAFFGAAFLTAAFFGAAFFGAAFLGAAFFGAAFLAAFFGAAFLAAFFGAAFFAAFLTGFVAAFFAGFFLVAIMIYLEYVCSAVRVNLSYLNLCKNAHTLLRSYRNKRCASRPSFFRRATTCVRSATVSPEAARSIASSGSWTQLAITLPRRDVWSPPRPRRSPASSHRSTSPFRSNRSTAVVI